MSDKFASFLHKLSSGIAVGLLALTQLQGVVATVPAPAPGQPTATTVSTLLLWAAGLLGALGHVGSVTAPK